MERVATVKKIVISVALAFVSSLLSAQTVASESPPADTVVEQLGRELGEAEREWIAMSVGRSATLASRLSQLLQDGALRGIRVGPPQQHLQGYYSKDSIAVTRALIARTRERTARVVGSDQTVVVNNAAFVIAYLTHRFATADTLSFDRFRNPLEYDAAATENTVAAFIAGWNAMVEVALQGNGGVPLSTAQVGELLHQARYKFVFLLPTSNSARQTLFSDSGRIEPSQLNIKVLAERLRHQQVADLK
jgi:hypothetical protein